MLLPFEDPIAFMGPFRQRSTNPGRSPTLSIRLALGPVAWAPYETDRDFVFPYSIDRFAGGALEIATLGAVVALFVAALV